MIRDKCFSNSIISRTAKAEVIYHDKMRHDCYQLNSDQLTNIADLDEVDNFLVFTCTI